MTLFNRADQAYWAAVAKAAHRRLTAHDVEVETDDVFGTDWLVARCKTAGCEAGELRSPDLQILRVWAEGHHDPEWQSMAAFQGFPA